MPNLDQPSGAVPFERCIRASNYVAGGTIYPGDFVKFDAAGKVVVVAALDASCGAALSYAAADAQVLVADDPAQRFLVQASAGEIDAQTDIGLNYSIIATAGNAAYKTSRHELDSSTGATTATLTLKLLRIDSRPNNALGANVDCVVQINNHQLGSSTGTAGV